MEEEESIGADGISLGWEGGKVLSGLPARSEGQERDEDVNRARRREKDEVRRSACSCPHRSAQSLARNCRRG